MITGSFTSNQLPTQPPSFVNREILLWFIIGLFASWNLWLDLWIYIGKDPILVILRANSGAIGLMIISYFIPIIYYLIFGNWPIRAIREYRKIRLSTLPFRPRDQKACDPTYNDERAFNNIETLNNNKYESATADELLTLFSLSSGILAKNIFRRAGVYLLIGVIIAFIGLAFFYSQTNKTNDVNNDTTNLLMSYGPRFGILFFIEFVAFFFLRQYKSAMDEFRYYEAIKRNREENLALIRFAKERKEEVDIFELIKNSKFYSDAGKLEKGETTEILESKKLQKDEIAIFEKIIESVGNMKKN